jgi:2-polyprenyl-3-methyl-5-hydroxy-6-metoxy-1,4-benzoquinol methylase
VADCGICGGRTEHETELGGYPIHRCRDCTHRRAVVAGSEATTPADYEALYATGEYRQSLVEFTRSTIGTDWTKFQTYAPFFERFRPSENLTVLDVACGTGRFVAAAAKAGFTISGADISATAVEVGREVFPEIDLQAIPLDVLAANGRRYRVVTAFEFVEHTAHPTDTLNAILSLVQPGGEIFLTVPNWNSPGVRGATRAEWLPPIHLQFFTRRSLRRLLLMSSRVVPSSITMGFIPKRPLFPISSWFKEPDGLFVTAHVR